MRSRNTDNLLCRFVTDGSGNKIGESVAIDKDVLIIKMGKEFIGVPLKHVEDLGDYLKVRGLLSIDKAREMGKRWEGKYAKRKR